MQSNISPDEIIIGYFEFSAKQILLFHGNPPPWQALFLTAAAVFLFLTLACRPWPRLCALFLHRSP